jgi:flagellar hook-length control protein FliK
LQQLAVRIDAPQRTAVVELEPAELGRLSVELSLEPEGGVRASVRAERPDGYAALETRLPELRAALLERGFVRADVQISLGFSDQSPRRPAAQPGRRLPAAGAPRALDAAELLALSPVRDGALDVWA